jgi:hypothetical protein
LRLRLKKIGVEHYSLPKDNASEYSGIAAIQLCQG